MSMNNLSNDLKYQKIRERMLYQSFGIVAKGVKVKAPTPNKVKKNERENALSKLWYSRYIVFIKFCH